MKQYSDIQNYEKEWIGKNPNNWKIIKNKFLFKISKNIVGTSSSEFQLLSMGKNGVNDRDKDYGEGKCPGSFDGYQIVQPNDLIFCLFDIDETPRTVGYSESDGMITSAYTVVKCFSDAVPKFIYYVYLAIDDRKGLRPFYSGLRKVVRSETFLDLKIKIPSVSEQRKIITYLDKKTKKIDSDISKNQRLIQLLEEKKQSMLNQILIKGLDSKILTKYSDVEWICEIPKHWNVLKLKYISYKIVKGLFDLSPDNYNEHGEPFLRISDIQKNKIISNKMKFVHKNILNENPYAVLNSGDIIIAKVGASAGNKEKIAILPKTYQSYLISQNLIGIKFNKSKMAEDFLFYYMQFENYLNFLIINSNISTFKSLRLDVLRESPILIPPIDEQKRISSFLEKKISQINELMKKINTQIQNLLEFRRTLVSSLSLGEINVNEVIAS